MVGILPACDLFNGRDALTASSTASSGRRVTPALSDSVPRLVAEETYDGSGPVEATVGSRLVGASLLTLLRPHTKTVLRLTFLS